MPNISKPTRILILALIAMLLVAIAARVFDWFGTHNDDVPSLLAIDPSPGIATYAAALKATDDQIALGEQSISDEPDDWLSQEVLARGLMARSKLSGSFDDMVRAGAALDRSRALAPKGAGAVLSDAGYGMMVHQLDRTSADLDIFDGFVIKIDQDAESEAAALRGDVLYYRGRYRDALGYYDKAAGISVWPGVMFRRAEVMRKTGDPDGALALYTRAALQPRIRQPQLVSSALLQAGALELVRGNWDAAEQCFQRADRLFSGYWLTHAHLAQMAALRGDTQAAERQYLEILAKGEHPEVMDALAALYRSQGERLQSMVWAAKAKVIWDARIKQLPQASYGHALEHELALGEPALALDYARKNYAARPYGDSAQLLAAALMANGKAGEAEQVLLRLNTGDWRGSQQYVLLAEAQALLGKSKASAAAREMALAFNPKAFDPAATLIWFGHH